jgi:hypothetical protein
MTFEFPCPWCGCDTSVRGSEHASWRFKLPCELCDRDMVLTWDGGLLVSRAASLSKLARTDEPTIRVRAQRIGGR